MSPTIFTYKTFRFMFFSREEKRMHVHIWSHTGEAKIWIEPAIELAVQKGFKDHEINELLDVTRERQDEIRTSWQRHFGG